MHKSHQYNLPVRTGTSDQPIATSSQQTVIATCQLQYPMPKTSDPEIENRKKFVYELRKHKLEQKEYI